MTDLPDPLEPDLQALNAYARPLPSGLRDRLEVAIVTGGAAARPLPAGLRARLEDALASGGARPAPASSRRWRTIMAVAAAVVLVAGTATALTGLGSGHGSRASRPPPRTNAGPSDSQSAAGIAAEPTTATTGAFQSATGGSFSSAAEARTISPWPAPPFTTYAAVTSADSLAGGSAASGPQTTSPPPAPPQPGPAVRVAVVGGNDDQIAGFGAYVQYVNGAGGAGGHQITIVNASSSSPGRNVIATVNLSGTAIASSGGSVPSWVGGPLLETDAATDAMLTGRVFDITSALERQAHLVVDAAVPSQSPGLRAVIYRSSSGPFSSSVPNAMEAVLRSRGVRPMIVRVSEPRVFVPADIAFVSLTTSDAKQWFADAQSAGYAPAQGMAGIGDLFDPEVLPQLPEGTRVESPYGLTAPPDEVRALERATGRPLGTDLLHGWVTAKALAYAVWNTNATDAATTQRGLESLAPGFQPFFAPQYEVRAGTHSRTPEGTLLVVRHGGFTAGDSFHADPR